MAITAQDVNKLRKMTGAGMMDCKKALTEANGDFDAAVDIIRKRGQAIASKRADREATEGAAIAKVNDEKNFGVILTLNCETDFVATNSQFVDLANGILELALNQKPANLDALKALPYAGATVAEKVTELSGVIGEKIDLSAFDSVSADTVVAYIHPGSKLSSLVGFNQAGVDAQVAKDVAMQVAAMSPVSVDRQSVPQSVIDHELSVAVEKTKLEMVQKEVEKALNKAGINPAYVDSEAHIESNQSKGWLTAEQADQARQIIKTVSEEKAASLPEQMIKNIANGRLNKFFKESTLMEQEFVKDAKQTIAQYLNAASKGLAATSFKRFSLGN